MRQFFSSKPNRLWMILSGFFVTNALVAEFMGVKLFSLEKTFGFDPVNWSFMGVDNLSFTLTAGVLLWPAVFIMTDIINEYYGPRGVRFLSYLTAGLIAYGFTMLFFALQLEPADFWRTAHIKSYWSVEQQEAMRMQVGDYNAAYSVVFGQSLWIIVGSLVAFLVGQVVDVGIFHAIKAKTGEGRIWLRSTGSTLVSQFLDSFVVVFIALYIGQGLPFLQVLAISIMNYFYKGSMALLLTPIIYAVHHAIEWYLGAELATEMKNAAQQAA
ncbi:MAG: queuosine precursor transporter [Bacteroidetes bacterium]|nr:queuosine precursor transporter [Bacteroidota bacterium]